MNDMVFAVWVGDRLEFTDEDKRACFDTANKLVEIAQEVRLRGLLSIDDKISSYPDFFMRRGLQLAVDSLEPDFIRAELQRLIVGGGYRGAELLRRLVILEGVIYIVEGWNPRAICESLGAFFGEDLLQEYLSPYKYSEEEIRKSELLEAFWDKIKDKQMHNEPGANLLGILSTLDDMAIQMLCRYIGMADLVLAAKGSSESVVRKLLENMSGSSAQSLIDGIMHTAAGLENVIGAQERVLAKLKELEVRGEIVLN